MEFTFFRGEEIVLTITVPTQAIDLDEMYLNNREQFFSFFKEVICPLALHQHELLENDIVDVDNSIKITLTKELLEEISKIETEHEELSIDDEDFDEIKKLSDEESDKATIRGVVEYLESLSKEEQKQVLKTFPRDVRQLFLEFCTISIPGNIPKEESDILKQNFEEWKQDIMNAPEITFTPNEDETWQQ